jgi:beta-mannosidase
MRNLPTPGQLGSLILALALLSFSPRVAPAAHAAAAPVTDSTRALSLSGDDWRLVSFEPGQGQKRRAFAEGYPASEAIPATVPGDVHWDLERAGRIPPIDYGLNSQKIGWVGGKEWWYRKTFAIPEAWRGKTVRLRFDAVDYLTEVWLNGRWLGRHEGQFTPFEFEVTELLRAGGENVLAVLIHPAPASVRDAIASGAGEWPVMTAMRKAYPRWKCQTNAGWDWGAKIITMGIWQEVRLIATDGLRLSDLTVLPRLAAPFGRATLHLQVTADSRRHEQLDLRTQVRCLTMTDPPILATQRVTLTAVGRPIAWQVTVPNPRLWWPNGYGPQHLYELTVTAHPVGSERVCDRLTTTFGVRDLQMLPNPDAPDNLAYIDYTTDQPVTHKLPQPAPERRYLIQINGRRIFARGGNWIPCDLLYGRPRQPAYEHLIRLAAQANYTLFRIWGGGLIDKPMFYELCDRYGIMLFQEFPNAGARLPETDEALAIAAEETRQVLPLLINHPSIVRYGGGNEWYRNAQNSRQMAQLRQICQEMDPTRPFHHPDPECIAQRHGPHGYEGDQHYRTYNSGHPLTAGPDNPLEWTEYGASGAASVETLRRIIPAEHLWPIRASDPYWTWHKAFGAYGADNWMASAQYLHLFGELPDLETTVRASQFVQAEGLRYANQAMRRFMWHRSACASWTYNEPWPNAAHGCIVEHYGRPKMAYYYTRSAYAPVDVSAEYASIVCRAGVPFPLKLFVTSTRAEWLKTCHLTAAVVDVRGREYDRKDWPLDVAPDASRAVRSLDLNPPDEAAGSVLLVQLHLCDAEGRDLSSQTYTFGVVKPDSANVNSAVQVPAVSPDGRRNLALLPGAKAAASSVLPGYAIHRVAHLNDGWYGNEASWIEGSRPSWAEIDLGAIHTISRVCIGNDHTQRFKDRGATAFRVLATAGAADSSAPTWQTVGTYRGEPLEGTKSFDFTPLQARCIRVAIDGGAGTRLDEIEVYESEPLPANQVEAAQSAAVRGPKPVAPAEAVPRGCLRPLLTAPATELELSVRPGTAIDLNSTPARVHRVSVRNQGNVPALFVHLEPNLSATEALRYHVAENAFTLLAGEAREVDVFEFAGNSRSNGGFRLRAKAWNSRAATVDHPAK